MSVVSRVCSQTVNTTALLVLHGQTVIKNDIARRKRKAVTVEDLGGKKKK